MRHSTWVLAYHGCDKETGEAILSGQQEIIPSANDYDWLGEGAYFWENSYSRALAWAEFLKKNPRASKTKIDKPFVVGAIIDPGNCLDLSEDTSLEIYKETYSIFKEYFNAINQPMPRNEPGYVGDENLVRRKLDCAVFNFMYLVEDDENQTPFDTIRSPFMEGGPIFEGSGIHSKTHIQWCVRNPKKHIWAYFRPRIPE